MQTSSFEEGGEINQNYWLLEECYGHWSIGKGGRRQCVVLGLLRCLLRGSTESLHWIVCGQGKVS